MIRLFLLSERQMARISPYFPLSHGGPRVDDRRVVSGIVYVIRNGLQWKEAPRGDGPHKTLYNRFIRWRKRGCSPTHWAHERRPEREAPRCLRRRGQTPRSAAQRGIAVCYAMTGDPLFLLKRTIRINQRRVV